MKCITSPRVLWQLCFVPYVVTPINFIIDLPPTYPVLLAFSPRDGHVPQLSARVGKVVVQRVGSGLASLGRQMSLKPFVISGSQDPFCEIDEGSDITAYMTVEQFFFVIISPLYTFSNTFFSISSFVNSFQTFAQGLFIDHVTIFHIKNIVKSAHLDICATNLT